MAEKKKTTTKKTEAKKQEAPAKQEAKKQAPAARCSSTSEDRTLRNHVLVFSSVTAVPTLPVQWISRP